MRALSRRFRGHFVAGLRRRARTGNLDRTAPEAVDAMLDALMATDWVVYAKPCLGHAERVVAYLAPYTRRTALSDSRLVGFDGERVAFRYTDRRDDDRDKLLWLDAAELIRRFLLHVLPKGLMRIRHYGFLANRCRAARLRQIRTALTREEESDDVRAEANDSGDTANTEPARPRRCPSRRLGALHPRLLAPQPRIEGG